MTPWIEQLRAAADVRYRRHKLKLAVYKVIGWSSLTIVICGALFYLFLIVRPWV